MAKLSFWGEGITDSCGEVSCTQDLCKEVVCSGEGTGDEEKTYALAPAGENDCEGDNKKTFANRKLKADLSPILKESVCCGTTA